MILEEKDIIKRQVFLESLPSFDSFCKNFKKQKNPEGFSLARYIGDKSKMLEDLFLLQQEYSIESGTHSWHFYLQKEEDGQYLIATDLPPDHTDLLLFSEPDIEPEL